MQRLVRYFEPKPGGVVIFNPFTGTTHAPGRWIPYTTVYSPEQERVAIEHCGVLHPDREVNVIDGTKPSSVP